MEHDPLFLAWFAGFVDGEGCLHIQRKPYKHGPSFRPVLVVSNTVKTPIDEIAARLSSQPKTGRVYTRTYRGDKKIHEYVVGGAHALNIVRLIRPYLRVKGEQADIFLTFKPRPAGGGGGPKVDPEKLAEQERLYQRLKVLKNRPNAKN